MRELIERIAERGERILLAINGLPLCGKSTVADGIASVIGGNRITTSTALRALNNPQINYQIDNGILVQDNIVCDAINRELTVKNDKLVIIDGCFRTGGQTRAIIARAHDLGFALIVAVELNVTYPAIRERFTTRGRKDDTLQKVTNRIRDYEHHAPHTIFALRDLTRYLITVNGEQERGEVLRDTLDSLNSCLEDYIEPACPFKGRVAVNY